MSQNMYAPMSPPQLTPIVLGEGLHDQEMEEGKAQGWFMDDDTSRRWVLLYYTPTQGTLKDSSEGTSSEWTKLWAGHLVIHFVWKEK